MNGADCAYTLSDDTEEMTLDEFIEFLEPQEEKRDPLNQQVVLAPARSGALCQSAEDWMKLKTALTQACEKLKKACSKELKESLHQVSCRIDGLQEKVSYKKLVQQRKKI